MKYGLYQPHKFQVQLMKGEVSGQMIIYEQARGFTKYTKKVLEG